MNDNMIPNEDTNEELPRTPFEEFIYHQRRALEETGKALEALLPEGFRTHSGEATKEFTKGFRVLIEAAMEEIKKASEKAAAAAENLDEEPPSTTGKAKVKVQVE